MSLLPLSFQLLLLFFFVFFLFWGYGRAFSSLKLERDREIKSVAVFTWDQGKMDSCSRRGSTQLVYRMKGMQCFWMKARAIEQSTLTDTFLRESPAFILSCLSLFSFLF
jgi:hypothetical protein